MTNRTVTAEVLVYDEKSSSYIGRMHPQRIRIVDEDKQEGVIIKDGRPVVNRGGKWSYVAK